ncbi:MAG: alanyl-tRNA editing protein [Candidatus Aminicenantia bacterium]
MTEKLYWKEPYSREFNATILRKEKGERGFKIILDRTLFYPTSGGQLFDKGWINGIEVLNVIEEGDEVIHILLEEPGGEKVWGKIDWERRFDNMQQHTGQHILSRAFLDTLGAETLSSNLGEGASVIELDLREIDWETVQKVELYANRIVQQNREIVSHLVRGDEWRKFPLRKVPPSEDLIRIIEIKNFDFSGCGGTHLLRTGEVGLIKISGWEKLRNNIRIKFLCGGRAVRDYQFKHKLLKKLSQTLTVGIYELEDAILKMREELILEKRKVSKLEEKLLENEIKELSDSKEIVIAKIYEGFELKSLRKIAMKLIEIRNCIVILGHKAEEGTIILAGSQGLNIDLRGFLKMGAEILKGKGGGTENSIQIGGEAKFLELAI